MLKTIRNRLLATLALLILGVVSLVALALVLFDPNDYRDDLARFVAGQINRPVRIEGAVDISWFPWLGLQVHDVTVEATPEFGPAPFLVVRSAQLRVQLLPLLDKKLQFDHIVLKGLELNLAGDENLKYNWDGMFSAPEPSITASAPETAQNSAPGEPLPDFFTVDALDLRGLTVKQGTVHWRDASIDEHLWFENIDLETGPGWEFPIRLACMVHSSSIDLHVKARLEGRARVDLDDPGIEILTAKLQGEGVFPRPIDGEKKYGTLTGTARYDPVRGEADVTDMIYETEGLRLAGDISGRKIYLKKMEWNGHARILDFDPDLLVKPVQGPAPHVPDMLRPLFEGMELETDFFIGFTKFSMSDIQGMTRGKPFTGDLLVDGYKTPAISCAVQATEVDLDRVLEPLLGPYPQGTGFKGAGPLNLGPDTLKDTERSLPGWFYPRKDAPGSTIRSIDIVLGADDVLFRGRKAHGVDAAFHMCADSTTFTANAASWTGGPLRLKGELQAVAKGPSRPSISIDLKSTKTRELKKALALDKDSGLGSLPDGVADLSIQATARDTSPSGFADSFRIALEAGLSGSDIPMPLFEPSATEDKDDGDAPKMATGKTVPPAPPLPRFQNAALRLQWAAGNKPEGGQRTLKGSGRLVLNQTGTHGTSRVDCTVKDAQLLTDRGTLEPLRLFGGSLAVAYDGPDILLPRLGLGAEAEAGDTEAGKEAEQNDAPLAPRLTTRLRHDFRTGRTDLADATLTLLGVRATGEAAIEAERAENGSDEEKGVAVYGTLRIPAFAPRPLLARLGIVLPDDITENALRQGAFTARYRYGADALRLDNLRLDLDGERTTGTFTGSALGSEPVWQFALESTGFDVDRYFGTAPKKEGDTPDTTAAEEQDLPPTPEPEPEPWNIDFLRGLRLDGSLIVGTLRAHGLDFTNAHIPVRAEDDTLTLAPLAATFYEGPLTGSLRLQAADVLQVTAKAEVKGFRMAPAMRTQFEGDYLGGKTDMQLDLTCRGLTKKGLLRTLAGSTGFAIRDGYYTLGSNKPKDKTTTTDRATDKPNAQPTPSPGQAPGNAPATANRSPFASVTSTWALDKGRAVNEDFLLQSSMFQADGKGWVDLGSKELDYTVLARFTGLPTLPIRVHGPFAKTVTSVGDERVVTHSIGRLGSSAFGLIRGIVSLPFDVIRRGTEGAPEEGDSVSATGSLLKGILTLPIRVLQGVAGVVTGEDGKGKQDETVAGNGTAEGNGTLPPPNATPPTAPTP